MVSHSFDFSKNSFHAMGKWGKKASEISWMEEKIDGEELGVILDQLANCNIIVDLERLGKLIKGLVVVQVVPAVVAQIGWFHDI